jgi:hypothetical protein
MTNLLKNVQVSGRKGGMASAELERPNRSRTHRRVAKVTLLVATVVALIAACTPEVYRSQDLVNAARVQHGRRALEFNLELHFKAQGWADTLAREQQLRHSYLPAGITQPWRKLGENVGVGGSVDSVHNAFMNSSGHRGNILDPAFNQIGAGVTRDGAGRYWVVQVFMQL